MNKDKQEEAEVEILAENGVMLVNLEKSSPQWGSTLSNIKMRSLTKHLNRMH